MNTRSAKIVLASAAVACVSAFVSSGVYAQLDLKGKLKEGLYETTGTTDMHTMPKDANKPASIKSCVTKADLENGKSDMFGETNKGQSSCEMKNVKQSGMTATFDMICPKEGVEMSTQITFTGDGMKGVTTRRMTGEMAKKAPPQFRTLKSAFETKYVGACTD
jgi:Protein of unknown function (DUF3617)